MPGRIIRPHPGRQYDFLASNADVALYGGAAGSGKSFCLLLDQGRWAASMPGFRGVVFRRTSPEITAPGALWDESQNIFPLMGATPRRHELRWDWPNGSWIKFSHLQLESDIYKWQGAQLCVASFDELPHFTANQFFYLLSRLRSGTGFLPYLRGTLNPDPTSWVKKLVERYIQPGGFPRMLPTQYFGRRGHDIIWADNPSSLELADLEPLSFDFIPAKHSDNPTLALTNPRYVANLKALPMVERARLLEGNWEIVSGRGAFFQRNWVSILPSMPMGSLKSVRYWDRAATEVSETNIDPDWTVGTRMDKLGNGRVVISDSTRLRGRPMAVENHIIATAAMDGKNVEVVLEQDPGQAGIVEVDHLTKKLAGYAVRTVAAKGHKADRIKPFSAYAESKNVDVVAGAYLDWFFPDLENLLDPREVKPPPGYHDDTGDSVSGGFNYLHDSPTPGIRRL